MERKQTHPPPQKTISPILLYIYIYIYLAYQQARVVTVLGHQLDFVAGSEGLPEEVDVLFVERHRSEVSKGNPVRPVGL